MLRWLPPGLRLRLVNYPVTANCKASGFSGLALGAVIICVAGALAGLWWVSNWHADVSFLPRMAPAEWIVYPVIPDLNSHRTLELPTVFGDSFVLSNVPPGAMLRIAGFHRYILSINGTALEKPLRTGEDWKQPDVFAVTGQLRPGTNRIEVTVFNSNGPPALWLSLEAGGLQVNSGEQWHASYAGAVWRAAVPATAPKPTPAANAFYRLPQPWASLGMRWPTLLAFTLLSTAGCWLLRGGSSFLPSNPCVAHLMTRMGGANRLREVLPLAALAGFWTALFVNNLGTLPPLIGFDVQGHIDYIRYIQERGSLPQAAQGWEMFQPPLYYLISAAWLGLFHLSTVDAGGTTALRILGLAVGITHLAIVWATLRLLFPSERSKALWGVSLAAFLPPVLYLSQYVTNEAFAAMMVSACLWLTLRALQEEDLKWARCAGLGFCLGAALLAKATAVLILPLVFGAFLWKWLEKRPAAPWRRAGRMGLIAAICALVGGWHYARLWIHYGNPLIGVWDPKLGVSWWQYDGYRTSAFYLRFGDVLLHPWSGTLHSFFDGMYATLWGDGLLGSALDLFARPPWNFDLMAGGYLLALLPTLAVMAGGTLALFKFVRRPSAEWFLLLGFGFLVLWAAVYMSLAVPYYCMVKAFYGLSALIPFCVCGALGMEFFTRPRAKLRILVCIGFGLWAINACACFWISRSSATVKHASVLANEGKSLEAADLLRQGLRSEPRSADLRFTLALLLTNTGRVDEGMRESRMLDQEHPDDCRSHQVLALAFAHEHQAGKAIEELRQTMAMAPGYDPFWREFTALLAVPEHPDDTISVCREALAMAPFSPGLRLALGSALLRKGLEIEASAQLLYAGLLSPEPADTLAALAWRLATNPQPAERNGTAAVKLAEQACALTGCNKGNHLVVLAAAYAEAGRYPDAIRTAERAEASAVASGDSLGIAASRELLRLVRTGRPFREK